MSFAPGQSPTRVILEQPGGWSRWSGRLAWIIAGISLVVAVVSAGANAQYFQTNPKVIEQYHSLAETAPNKIAIIDISGAIMGGGASPDTRSIRSKKTRRSRPSSCESIHLVAPSAVVTNFTTDSPSWLLTVISLWL